MPSIATIIAGEDIPINCWVYIDPTDNKVYKADPSVEGKESGGYCKTAFLTGIGGQVYLEGIAPSPYGGNDGELVYLSTTPGTGTLTIPDGSIQIVARLLPSAKMILNFYPSRGVSLAASYFKL